MYNTDIHLTLNYLEYIKDNRKFETTDIALCSKSWYFTKYVFSCRISSTFIYFDRVNFSEQNLTNQDI